MSAAYLLPFPSVDVDPTSLPIGPREAFVLSRIDGVATVSDLVHGSGLDEETVRSILARLEQLGAIHFASAAQSSLPPRPGQTSASSTRIRAVQETPSGESRSGPSTPQQRETPVSVETKKQAEFDQAQLEEAVDLPREMKEEILRLHGRLTRVTHYALLGVAEDADKKAIKVAYFERVSVFHADRFFGKELGSYKALIERIFGALTKAHDTLTRAQLRQQYDNYLRSRRATRELRDSLPPSSPQVGLSPQIPPAPKAPSLLNVQEPPLIELEPVPAAPAAEDEPFELEPSSEQPAARTPSSGSPPLRASLAGSLRPSDPAAARRLLAKKLGHRLTTTTPNPASESDKDELRRAVGEQMRARYEARQNQANGQVNRYVEMAHAARAKREWGSALNSLRIALTLSPDDSGISDLLSEIEEEADRHMADQFVEQAKYEEADGHLDRAARSYERAARGKSSEGPADKAAALYERAAHCLMAARGDRRKVVELARLAVTLDAKRVSAHLLLAQAYDMVQMRTSALGEVSRALELDPNNEEAKHLQKQLR